MVFFKNKRGFTVIEIITIIGVIAGLVGAISFVAQGLITSGKAARISSDIRSIKIGSIAYNADTGAFPSPETLNDNGYYRLITEPSQAPPNPLSVPGWDGPYLDTPSNRGSQSVTYSVFCDGTALGCQKSGDNRFEQVIYVNNLTGIGLINKIEEILDNDDLNSGFLRWVTDHFEMGVMKKN